MTDADIATIQAAARELRDYGTKHLADAADIPEDLVIQTLKDLELFGEPHDQHIIDYWWYWYQDTQ